MNARIDLVTAVADRRAALESAAARRRLVRTLPRPSRRLRLHRRVPLAHRRLVRTACGLGPPVSAA